MCGRFTIASIDEVQALARTLEYGDELKQESDEAPTSDAYPNKSVPVLLTQADAPHPLRARNMNWGFPLAGKSRSVFNTRIETAGSSSMWRESFEQRHCVIPARAFFETSSFGETMKKLPSCDS